MRHLFEGWWVAVCLVAGATGPEALAQVATPLKLSRVASGFDLPVLVTAPRGEREVIYVVEQRGVIRTVSRGDGQPFGIPFLDITNRIRLRSHEGLLGMCFHPDFRDNDIKEGDSWL